MPGSALAALARLACERVAGRALPTNARSGVTTALLIAHTSGTMRWWAAAAQALAARNADRGWRRFAHPACTTERCCVCTRASGAGCARGSACGRGPVRGVLANGGGAHRGRVKARGTRAAEPGPGQVRTRLGPERARRHHAQRACILRAPAGPAHRARRCRVCAPFAFPHCNTPQGDTKILSVVHKPRADAKHADLCSLENTRPALRRAAYDLGWRCSCARASALRGLDSDETRRTLDQDYSTTAPAPASSSSLSSLRIGIGRHIRSGPRPRRSCRELRWACERCPWRVVVTQLLVTAALGPAA